jgi:hypothetical protein
MISHLRLAASNPNYRPPSSLHPKSIKGKAIGQHGHSDRTTLMQNTLRHSMQKQYNSVGSGRAMMTVGDMPTHLHGRGHLEGSQVSKLEGLLENKQHKRKRRRGNGGKPSSLHNGDGDDGVEDGYSMNSDEEEEEEELKVWKPSSSSSKPSEKKGGGGNTFSTSSSLPPSKSGGGGGGGVVDSASSAEVEGEIKSLMKEGLDWNKNSKFGKKSHTNFEKWLGELAEKLHEEQVAHEDDVFNIS